MTDADTRLVVGRQVICGIDANGVPEVVDNGAVLIGAQGRIEAVGPAADLRAAHPEAAVAGSPGDVIAPGFVNSHHHVGLTPFQLGAPDLPLELWFSATMGTRERDPYLDTLYSAFEMIASGVTTVQHLHIARGSPAVVAEKAEATLRAYRDIGMRVSYSYAYRDQNRLAYEDDAAFLKRLPPPLAAEMAQWFSAQHFPLEEYLAFVSEMHRRHTAERTAIQLAPANLHWCSDQALAAIGGMSRERQMPMHMHLLETPYQAAYGRTRSPEGAVKHLEQLGLLGPLLTLGHAVWLAEDDLDLLAASGTCICHNASSNMRLASGTAPCRHLVERGLRVAIGIDEAGINDDRDMLQELRLVAHLHKAPGVEAKRIGASGVFRMATEHGAHTTPFAGRIGRIAPGMAADLVLYDWSSVAAPYLDSGVSPVDAIVYRAKSAAVRAVIIAGATVYENGRFLNVDREAALDALSRSLSGARTADDERRRAMGAELLPHLQQFYRSGTWGDVTDRLALDDAARAWHKHVH